ncbi:hypothetical protein [Streptomyces violarus]|uniref:hypothetical protein n=1 Tax=Streptomyces violarus TaxID=67380 RepID=UPI0021C1A811|nr:hypothetical protein [Streptomyces violarus]MCT9140361.1 hypothetical protein [Streptomyces violarus]
MEIAACGAQDIEVVERLMPSHSVDGHHAAPGLRRVPHDRADPCTFRVKAL